MRAKKREPQGSFFFVRAVPPQWLRWVRPGQVEAMRTAVIRILVSLLFVWPLLASAEQGGSITIDGKTIVLPYVQAFAAGHNGGRPTIDVMLAEKPLDGLQWWGSEAAFAAGKHGVVLRLQPTLVRQTTPDAARLDYEFNEDYATSVHAPSIQDWAAWSLSRDGITLNELSVTEYTAESGTLRGNLAWTGKVESVSYSAEGATTSVVTAWTAKFELPLKNTGSPPK